MADAYGTLYPRKLVDERRTTTSTAPHSDNSSTATPKKKNGKRRAGKGKAKSATVEKKTEEMDESLKTMVIMRNIPPLYSTKDVLDLLYMYEYIEVVDFVYVPLNFTTKQNFGYSFINFVNPEDARFFKTMFQGFYEWMGENTKEENGANRVCSMSWSSNQCLQTRINRFRTSALMHASVPDIFKPVLLESGNVIAFPVCRDAVEKRHKSTKNYKIQSV